MPVLLKLLPTVKEEGKLPNFFCEASVTVIPKPDKDTAKQNKTQASISDEHGCKNQNMSKQNATMH